MKKLHFLFYFYFFFAKTPGICSSGIFFIFDINNSSYKKYPCMALICISVCT